VYVYNLTQYVLLIIDALSAPNPCEKSPCQHLCLLSPVNKRGYVCRCPLGLTVDPQSEFKCITGRSKASPRCVDGTYRDGLVYSCYQHIHFAKHIWKQHYITFKCTFCDNMLLIGRSLYCTCIHGILMVCLFDKATCRLSCQTRSCLLWDNSLHLT